MINKSILKEMGLFFFTLYLFNYIKYEKHIHGFLISQLKENTQKLFTIMPHSWLSWQHIGLFMSGCYRNVVAD